MKQQSSSIFASAGWLVAAALGTVMLASGFQANAPKFGHVDMNKVVQDSNAGKALQSELRNQFNLRQGLLEYASRQRVLTEQQAAQLLNLTLKPNQTEADKTALDKLKADIEGEVRAFNQLNTVASPNETQRSQLAEYNRRIEQTENTLRAWQQQFSEDMNDLLAKGREDLSRKARTVVNDLSRRQGFTVVFDSTSAIYSANDLTDAATKALEN
jgi:Skp family chaperone for outer membrane proteins